MERPARAVNRSSTIWRRIASDRVPECEWRDHTSRAVLDCKSWGERIAVDTAGLLSHAGVCDAAASTILVPTPPVAGHLTQATTAAVAHGHAVIDAFAARLAERATATGTTLRTAAGEYATADSDSAQSISTTVHL